jgi:hypothetical protein
MTATTTEILKFDTRADDGYGGILYTGDSDELMGVACRKDSEDYGAVLVRVGIDGDWDGVYLDRRQSPDVAVMRPRPRRSAYRPRAAHERLARGQRWDLHGTRDWGRCRARDGHAGDHEFPTEAGGMADLEAWIGRRRETASR